MEKKVRFFIILMSLSLWLGIFPPADAYGSLEKLIEANNILPANTVLIANEVDARFSRDFSTLLKHLRLEWIVLDSTEIPDAVKDKNLILIGHPDSPYTGKVIRGMLSADEIEMFQSAADHHVILQKESPWGENHTVIICSGADFLLRRNAAEEVFRSLISNSPPASGWVQTTYEAPLDENMRDYVESLQFEWEDTELSLHDLTMDVGAKPRRRITAQQAVEDVERLFYLFSHGYSGYAFFDQQGKFELAKKRILQELSSQSSWSDDAFSRLLYDHLNFIVDCHMTIGEYRFAGHRDFWYDTRLELKPEKEGYVFETGKKIYTVLSINDADPAPYILPSLNKKGEPIYRFGLLSSEKPQPLLLTAVNEGEERQFKIKLKRSDFNYYTEGVFREDVLGGIPVIRVRSFGDYYSDQLNEFAGTGTKYRGEPVIILDIRGNGGGNEHWPISWIQRLTGRRAESVFIFSELESKTSMVGRANTFNYWYYEHDVSSYSDEVEQFARITKAFESGARRPGWTGPLFPQLPLIPNGTTVIVVINDRVASAGEGLVMRISQLENVMVVGENSKGCLTFGNVSNHQLPNSRLMIGMPINFGLFPDLAFREEVGLAPDIWVPAAEAVNYTVAALRQGTITSFQTLSKETLKQPFIPESPWSKIIQFDLRSWLVMAVFAVGGTVFAYNLREKMHILLVVGVIWIGLSWYWIYHRRELPLAFGFLFAGVGYLIIGISRLWRKLRVDA